MQVSTHTLQPMALGLSDLTQDECFIVSLSRAWRRLAGEETRDSMIQLLRSNRVYPALGPLFAAFSALIASDPVNSCDCDQLSQGEEALLDQLTSSAQGQVLQVCQAALRQAHFELRPLGCIRRQCRGRLTARMDLVQGATS